MELFADSNPENQEKGQGEPLGLLAERVTMALLEFTFPGFGKERVTFGLLGIEPWMVPILGCYGLVEEQYMDLKKQAIRIDNLSGE